MNKKKKNTPASDCIHCHICQKNCTFLTKYNIDIGNLKELKDLAYSCFLCGKCTEVCPIGIDGRKTVLNFRKERVRENNNKLDESGYSLLVFEKNNYKFKSYRNAKHKSVIFPGCSFPAHYPELNKYITKLFYKEFNIGCIYDCCGKPIHELGLEEKEKNILDRINKKIEENGVEEIIMFCPNCYYYLRDHLNARVVNIFEKLKELGIGKKVKNRISIFSPCPDRYSHIILQNLEYFLEEKPILLNDDQCCGLGGCAYKKEKELAKNLPQKIDRDEFIFTYCASCSGSFVRKGFKSRHILSEILGIYEEPDTQKSVFNRLKAKMRRL